MVYSLFKLRKIFFSAVFAASVFSPLFAETYFWVGDSGGGDNVSWEDGNNWYTEITNDGSGLAAPDGGPSTDDVVRLPKQCAITLNSDVTINTLEIPNPNLETQSFSCTINSNGYTLTVSEKIEVYRSAATGSDADAVSSLILNCGVNTPLIEMHSGGNITFGTDTESEIIKINNSGGDSPSTLLTVEGELKCQTLNMSNVTTRKLELKSGGSLVLKNLSGNSADSPSIFGSDDFLKNDGTVFIEDGFNGNLGTYISSDSSGNLSFFGTVSCTDSIEYSGNVDFSGTFSCSGSVQIDGYAKILGDVSFSDSFSAKNILLDGSENLCTLTVNKMEIEENFLCLGDVELKVSDSSSQGISVSENSGTSGSFGNFIVAGNASQNAVIETPLSAKNIVFYGSNVFIKNNLFAKKDFLIFGTSYNEKDLQTGLAIFSYAECAATFCSITSPFAVNYLEPNSPAAFFAGTDIQINVPTSSDYCASLTVDSGVTVSVGENFFANGVTVNSPAFGDGSNEWNLKIRENKNKSGNFAFAANCNFAASNCAVYGWDGNSGSGTRVSSGAAGYDGAKIVVENSSASSVPSDDTYSFAFDSESLLISEDNAYTTSDNVVYIQFNREIRNIDSQITDGCSAGYIKNSAGNYTAFYTDESCTIAFSNGEDSASKFYIKISDAAKWNTSASGTYAGETDETDLFGTHRNSKPTVEILRAKNTAFDSFGNLNSAKSYFITDLWGKRIEHYSEEGSGSDGKGVYTNTEDKCPPALVKVSVGQELHKDYEIATGAESQHSYDGHNFIEFRYSEAVDFALGDSSVQGGSGLPAEDALGNFLEVENIAVTDSFGVLLNNIENSGNLIFAGLGIVALGKIYTAKNGAADKYVNALYRKDKYSVRISIAGLTDGTKTYGGNSYKNWSGYIEEAVQPSGSVTLPSSVFDGSGNSLVSDLNGNIQKKPASSALQSISVTADGGWDTSSPVFALLNISSSWSTTTLSATYNAEAVGNTPGSGSVLDRIEFHFFDNTPSSSDSFYWRSGKGWCSSGSENLYKSFSYGADIFGGSEPFADDDSKRTPGGLRLCTLADSLSAFKYSVIDEADIVPNTDFSSLSLGASSTFFLGNAASPHPTGEKEGLYLTLKLSDSALPVFTTFAVSYDGTIIITDYAGNKLKSATVKTLDRTPPSFDISLSPVAKNKINLVFVKSLQDKTSQVYYKIDEEHKFLSDSETSDFKDFLPQCFQIIKIDSDGTALENDSLADELVIDTSFPAEISHIKSLSNEKSFTKITLTTNRNITLDDIKNCYVRVISPLGFESSKDPITEIETNVTFLQDEIGNYVPLNSAHAISDFAINAVNPLFANPNDLDFAELSLQNSLQSNPWTVRDFSRAQKNYGTLPVNQSFDIIAELKDGSDDSSFLPDGVRVYFCSNPDAAAISKQINEDLNLSLRTWLPQISTALYPSSIFRAFSNVNISASSNSSLSSQMAEFGSNRSKIQISVSKEKAVEWSRAGQVQFMFSLTDGDGNDSEELRFCSSPVYDAVSGKYQTSSKLPLFAFTLENESDIFSLDLWSVSFKEIKNQRGGVTILNNVINPEKNENCIIKVNLSEAANLNIIIMTADGNVVKYLSHGEVGEGEHYFLWDGKNKNGKAVARGIYFIRITGSGIDENRKVMVVK